MRFYHRLRAKGQLIVAQNFQSYDPDKLIFLGHQKPAHALHLQGLDGHSVA